MPPVLRARLNGATSSHGMRSPVILIVDDEPNIVEFLTMMLEDEGYRVLKAYDGEQALELMERTRPDLVISDIMMPRLDGMDLLKMARGRLSKGCPTMIFMSAVSQRQPPAGTPFIQKPFDIDDMLGLVNAELKRPRAPQIAG